MHPHTLRFRTTCAATVALALAIGACSNNDDNISPNNRFLETKITADNDGNGANADAHLINPWGIAFGSTGVLWVANNGTGTSTTYNGSGAPQSTIVTIPSAGSGAGTPTGIVL